MVEDIRIKTTFPWHRKVRRLSRELGQDSTGYLLRLFIRTAMTRPDGCLRDMDAVDIACDAEWTGDAGVFLDALRLCGWVDMDAGGVLWLHDWAEHQAWVVGHEERSVRAKKAIETRWGRMREGQSTDTAGQGAVASGAEKMPEVGPKTVKYIHRVYGENTGSNTDSASENTGSNTPLQCLSSPKGIKTPPERANALSTPVGGERQPARRFLAPTVDEIAEYCTERGNGLDPQAIHDHYTANGWKVGKNPMRDWKASVRTWEARRRQEHRERATSAATSQTARLLAKARGEQAQ